MLIRDLFVSDVTRDIPPVVYFHEQGPDKVASEVAEYIVTGGWPKEHPSHRRVPDGIHEQYVRLLTGITGELDKPGGPSLPTAWISGFYGSGKSSFAKLLGLALDGLTLPDGTALHEALLRRDTSPRTQELRDAWAALTSRIDPIAVVFDVGGVARDGEHIHSVAVRQVQKRLGYCPEPLVADFELRLQRDGQWEAFEQRALDVLGEPWATVKDRSLAEDEFSLVMSELFPDKYTDPMAWYGSRAGTHTRSESPEEAVARIRDMLRFRRPGATLFMVIDEVSQYVLAHKDRVDRLRAFATELGAKLHGKAWLLALGQQKLDEEQDESFLGWARERFPQRLRVHLAPTNIRDVVHRRLLHKRPDAEALLGRLFEQHRASLKLYAYKCEAITPEELVETYPLLPGHIDLLLRITSALRARSTRAQGDDHAIRGLLQLLGELFRDQDLASQEVGALVTLDQIYAIQHTALDADVQASMARILEQCKDDPPLTLRAAKAVALLELVADTDTPDAKLVASCLYDRLDRGDQLADVTRALEDLRRRNLLGYSEKQGYKIQSSAAEEWERERRDVPVARETVFASIQDALRHMMAEPARPTLQGRPFPWGAMFSDGRRIQDALITDPREEACARVDFRFLVKEERTDSAWVKRSDDAPLSQRLLWIAGDTEQLESVARELARSQSMVRKYQPRKESLNQARKILLLEEESRTGENEARLRHAIAAALLAGRMVFRGRPLTPTELGASFKGALETAGAQILPSLFPHFVATTIAPSELSQLLQSELTGPSPKFLGTDLGILELDAGRYTPSCTGVVPVRVLEHIEAEQGTSGAALLAHFGGPPYGYTANVVKACVLGLLRASKVRLHPEGAKVDITAVRDAGVQSLFDGDRLFRRAEVFPAGKPPITPQDRARICRFFEEHLRHPLDRDDGRIADAVASDFPAQAARLRKVLMRLARLPGPRAFPPALDKLQDTLEGAVRLVRETEPVVTFVAKHLDLLRDGVQLLNLIEAELTQQAVDKVAAARRVHDMEAVQLAELGPLDTAVTGAVEALAEHLGAEKPWRDVGGLDPAVHAIREAYEKERGRLLELQEQGAEAARARVKQRDGFAKLSADQSHHVLRPIAEATANTTVDAIAPALTTLRDGFRTLLREAEDEANARLDGLQIYPMVRVDLRLRNRELSTIEDVEALLEEVRGRLLAQIEQMHRVRLV